MPLLVEMGWGGLVQYPSTITWTDITPYVDVVQGVAIARGAADELAETQPGTATLLLDNADGRFTPGNPTSPYYPFVRRNAPIRAAVAVIPQRTGTAPYPLAMLADDFDDGRLDATLWPNSYGGASEVGGRARVPATPGGFAAYQTARTWTLTGSQLSVKLATVPAANGSSSATATMMINSLTAGTRIGFSYNPVTGALRLVNEVGYFDGAATVLTYSAIDHAWIRVREAAGTLYWETSRNGFGWTVRRTLATPAWVGTDQVTAEFGASRTGGTGDYAEFDLAGAIVRPRFYGTVNEFPVEWQGLYSKVPVTCTDLFKRLNRLPSLKSMLVEETLAPNVPGIGYKVAAYYPLGEEAGATSAGDLSGQNCGPLNSTQVGSGGALDFGSDSLPAAADGAVTFTPVSATTGKYLTGDLGAAFETDDVNLITAFSCWFKTTTNSRAFMGMYSGNLDTQLVLALNGSGALTVETTVDGGFLFVSTVATGNLANDTWHHVYLDLYNKRVFVDGVQIGGSVGMLSVAGLRMLNVGGFRSSRLWSGQVAHVSIGHSNGVTGPTLAPVHYAAGMTGFEGETADVRIQRLARYAGLTSVTIWGSTHDPVAGQGPGGTGALARMREIEATESGRLWAERDWFGLAYQSRDVRYNPSPASETFTIDYADLEPGIELADDDQKLVNLVDATRPGGATQRVTADSSILAFGDYPKDMNLLKTTDNSVLDAAMWLVTRYANPDPELRKVPIEAHTMSTYLDILDAEIGSYFSVYNLPSQATAPSMRVTVEGYTETIKHNSHLIEFQTSASLRDSVWVLDDPVYGILGTSTRLAY